MSIRKRIVGAILSLSLLTMIPVLSNASTAYADNKTEVEFKSVIEKYNPEDLVIENGISLKLNENLDLSDYPNWEISNKDVASIDNNGMLIPTKEGTTFLSQKIGSKVHIVEVYVYKEETKYLQSESNARVSRNYYKVFIDPGHGGSDSGATGFGRTEKKLNMEIANRVKSKLEAKGVQIKMSRTTDVYLTLAERAQLANSYGADVFASIHQNSAGSSDANGIETFHHVDKASHRPLSADIQTNLIAETNAKDRGVKSANFGVLRMSNMPSTLVECGFISNQIESSRLGDPAYQEKVATAISNGIYKYLKDNIKLDEDTTNPPLTVIDNGTVTSTDPLNVRSGYGVGYSVIGTLSTGSRVEIVDKKDGWYKIKYNGGYGCVSGSYIKLDSQTTPDPNSKFTDLANHWAKEVILDFADKGYINGYVDNTFKPDNDITRAEFVKVVNRVFGLTNSDQITNLEFTDVISSEWYYKDLCIAKQAGYINGYDDNTFRPNGKITRQEAASIVASIANLSGDGNLNFADSNQIDDWAKGSVDAVSDNDVMGGYNDNTFKPKNSITRAEAVSTLSRVK